MATTRIEFRLDEKLKEKVEKASALAGAKSTTDYVLSIMEKEANKVISRYERAIIKDDIFDRFMDACERARKPNKALLDAVAFAKKQGIK
jgi:uncharacterized protein (DUF1778 family)